MNDAQIQQLQLNLLSWFTKNKRDLPWRNNRNWYKTYLSEIILQQTTVDQGIPYFNKFLKRFPTCADLAGADEQEILLMWAGLGYYSRGRNLLKSANIITEKYKGQFPETYKEALSLPGVGSYSASAILSISFGQPYAVVDGNVIRVISRLMAIKGDTRKANILNHIKENAEKLLDKENPGEYNEALMELGAIVCYPLNPDCSNCPLKSFCISCKKDLVKQIPFKSKASPKHKKFQAAGVLEHDSKICIVRNPSSGLSAGMWQFPALELDRDHFSNGFSDMFKKEFGIQGDIQWYSQNMTHIYSHIKLTFKAVNFLMTDNKIDQKHYQDIKWIEIEEINNYAIHNAHKKILEWYLNLKVES